MDHNTKQKVVKPKCVQEYKCNIGADMIIVNYVIIRHTQRWYKNVFVHLVDLAVQNSHALYLYHLDKNPTLI